MNTKNKNLKSIKGMDFVSIWGYQELYSNGSKAVVINWMNGRTVTTFEGVGAKDKGELFLAKGKGSNLNRKGN